MNNWQALPPRTRALILYGIPVLIVGVFGWLAWGNLKRLGKDPALNAVSFLQRDGSDNLYATLRQKNQAIEAERLVIERRDQVMDRLAEIDASRELILERLPTTREKEKMRRGIQEMANLVTESGTGQVEFVSLTIDEPTTGDGQRRNRQQDQLAQEIIYRCSLKADLNGLIHYIHKVENNPRFMAVREISLSAGGVDVDADNRVVDFELHTIGLEIVTYVLTDGTTDQVSG